MPAAGRGSRPRARRASLAHLSVASSSRSSRNVVADVRAGRTGKRAPATKVEMRGDDLTASGEFELTHTALGMMPFSVMLGALQVADGMKFVYNVHADAVATAR